MTHILPQAVLVPDLAARARCSAMLDSYVLDLARQSQDLH